MKSRTLVGKVQLKLSALVFILPKNTAFWNQWNSEKTKKSEKKPNIQTNCQHRKLNFNKTKSETTRHITSCILYTFTSHLAEKIVQQWSSCLTQSPWKINPSGSFWSFYYIFYQVRTTAIFSCNWRRFVLESSCQKHQKQYYQTFPRYIVKSFSRNQVKLGVFFQLQQNSQKIPLLITTTNC